MCYSHRAHSALIAEPTSPRKHINKFERAPIGCISTELHKDLAQRCVSINQIPNMNPEKREVDDWARCTGVKYMYGKIM
jgi:hypothetical protein